MVSTLDSGLSGLGSSPGWDHCVVFLDRVYLATDELSGQADEMPGGSLRWTKHPIPGERVRYPFILHARETKISSSWMGYLARVQT